MLPLLKAFIGKNFQDLSKVHENHDVRTMKLFSYVAFVVYSIGVNYLLLLLLNKLNEYPLSDHVITLHYNKTLLK